MNTAAEIKSISPPMDAPKMVLCIGLDDAALEIVSPLISYGFFLKTLTFFDPPGKIKTEIDEAAIVFIQWDGVAQKAHKLLLSRENRPGKNAVPVHMILRNGASISHLPPRQAKELSIAGWIELPQKYFEIERLIYDLSGEAEAEVSTPAIVYSGTQPHQHDTSRPDKKMTESGSRDEACLGAPAMRELTIQAPAGANLEIAFRNIVEVWKKSNNSNKLQKSSKGRFTNERLVVVHPDEAFATEISLLLEECGVPEVRRPRSVDDTMLEMRRGATGLILWFDGSSRLIYSILEHMTESRQLTFVPILVLLPSRDVAQVLGTKLRAYFFDAIAFYDRKKETLTKALASMQSAKAATDTPRAILEQMRRPLRLESPPEMRRSIPLADLEILAQKVIDRPGKKYWGVAELIPHFVLGGEVEKAIGHLREAVTGRPNAYNTLVLRTLVARQTPKKDEITLNFAQAVLKYPDLTADRLFRAALMLERWKAPQALAVLLDGWSKHPTHGSDSQLFWMAGKYYLLAHDHEKAYAFMSHAANLEPHRTDYAEGVARIFASTLQYDRAASILRFVSKARDCSWDAKVLLPHVLFQSRNIKEAHDIVEQLLTKAPRNHELLQLKTKLN